MVTTEELGDIGGSKGRTDCYGHEKEKLEWFGQMKQKQQNSCRNEDGGKAP